CTGPARPTGNTAAEPDGRRPPTTTGAGRGRRSRSTITGCGVVAFVVSVRVAIGSSPPVTLSSTSCSSRCRSPGVASSSQERGAATVGRSRPRNEYGATVVLDPLFWDQSISTFPRRAVLAMVETTKVGNAFSSSSAASRAQPDACSLVIGWSIGTYRCRPLEPL